MKALDTYIDALEKAGSAASKVIQPLVDITQLDLLSALENVSIPAEFQSYLLKMDGYNPSKCRELDIMDPVFAWNMEPIPLKKIISHYPKSAGSFADDPDYWPTGFVAFLWSAGGDEMVINCIATSPTFGAIYYFKEGVGINRVANSLSEFLIACTEEITQGLYSFEDPEIPEKADPDSYFEKASAIYGYTPYFDRKDAFDTQLVDWVV